MNPLMPFLSETLFHVLPGKNKIPVAHTKFPESIEVYFSILQKYKSLFNVI